MTRRSENARKPGRGIVAHNSRLLICYWIPPILLMSLIFYLSSLSGLPDFEEFDFAMKKLAHLTVYAVLYLLLFRAFYSTTLHAARPLFNSHLAAVVIAVLYAISDEIHQYFVPFRTATIRDVLIDTAGVLLMYLIVRRRPRLFRRILAQPATLPAPDRQPR